MASFEVDPDGRRLNAGFRRGRSPFPRIARRGAEFLGLRAIPRAVFGWTVEIHTLDFPFDAVIAGLGFSALDEKELSVFEGLQIDMESGGNLP